MLGPMAADRPSAILKSNDIPATIAWYRDVGFDVREAFPDEHAPTFCEVARDDVVLQFLGGDDTPWPEPPGFTGTIYFYPESVDALHERIRGRVEPAWGPEHREWGMRELGLRDPNGYYLTFCEPAEAPEGGG
jgi:catechol 2,3-dioxygenase-like lactoylglutathione lyase family enzyme